MQKERKNLLAFKFAADALWALHFFLRSYWGLAPSYSACLLNLVGMAREFVFYHSTTKKWAGSRLWLVVFLTAGWVSTLLTWQGPVCLVAAVSTSCCILSLGSRAPRQSRLWGIPTYALWGAYALLTGSVTALLSSLMALSSIVVGCLRHDRRQGRRCYRCPPTGSH